VRCHCRRTGFLTQEVSDRGCERKRELRILEDCNGFSQNVGKYGQF